LIRLQKRIFQQKIRDIAKKVQLIYKLFRSIN
jgi:hypothetical protein